MNLFDINFNQHQVIALVLVVVTAKLFVDHRRANYGGEYEMSGTYENISAAKHDFFKVLVTEIFPVLVVGLATGDKWFDMEKPLNTVFGRALVLATGYLFYHEVVQPYVVNRTPLW